MNNLALIHRLNRASGQLEALKRSLEDNTDDCRMILQQVKAVSNALKRFGEAYVKEKAGECLKSGKNKDEIELEFTSLLTDIFNL